MQKYLAQVYIQTSFDPYYSYGPQPISCKVENGLMGDWSAAWAYGEQVSKYAAL